MLTSFKHLFALMVLGLSAAVHAAPLPVVASFSILGDMARQIGGERVAVQTLVGADADAHAYQLTPANVRTLRAAQLLLVNGLGFESAAMQRAMKASKVPVATATTGMAPIHGDEGADPHVWNDPALMPTYTRNIANALIQADPAGQAHYEQRLAAYQRELQALDAWAQQQFVNIPAAQRKVLTAHDAFAYLGRRYQIAFIAPLGMSAESDASAKTVARIVTQVRREKIRAVFLENIKDARLVQQLARETGVAVRPQKLYSDALSNAQGPAATYVQLVRHNVTAIAQALRETP